MGREHPRTGEHLLFYLAAGLILILSVSGCSHVRSLPGREQLWSADRMLQEGNHDAALAQAMEVLENYYEPLGDRALFQMGLIYVHPRNPAASCDKALVAFQRVGKEFPRSPLGDQAGMFASVLQQLVETKESLRALEADKAEKAKRLVRLDSELDEKEKRIAKYHRTVMERQVEINRLKAQISEFQKRLDRVEAQLSDMKKVDIRMEERRRPVLQ